MYTECTYIRTYMHACMHAYIHTYIIYIYIHIYIYINFRGKMLDCWGVMLQTCNRVESSWRHGWGECLDSSIWARDIQRFQSYPRHEKHDVFSMAPRMSGPGIAFGTWPTKGWEPQPPERQSLPRKPEVLNGIMVWSWSSWFIHVYNDILMVHNGIHVYIYIMYTM